MEENLEYKCYFASLGCDINLVDSEKMMSLLDENNIVFTDDEYEADIIIVNTCGFILDAKKESIETILELSAMKQEGRCRALIVTGCLSERYSDEIRKEIPEVDAIVGTNAYGSIWEAVSGVLSGSKPEIFMDKGYIPRGIIKRVRSGPFAHRYLKIAEGCDKHCSYCAIPMMRGPYVSVPMEELVSEASMLAKDGTKELILVAQETTLYGIDLYGEKRLPMLLKKLCEVDGIEWIRLMYCYPEEITSDLIETMVSEPKICHYLDIPIQHFDDDILKRMGRRTSRQELVDKIKMIRSLMPDAALRTTLISGFPGETIKAHQTNLKYIKETGFDRLGVFPYSEEEGTPAALFEDRIDPDTRKQRADELMATSEKIVFEKNKQMTGKTLNIMVEGYLREDDCYVGRSYRDAPDIDGLVFFESDDEYMTGNMVRVKITKAKGYDLYGTTRKGETFESA